MKQAKRTAMLATAGVLLLGAIGIDQGFLRSYWLKNYKPQQTGIAEGLSPDQMLVAFAGFREMVASILWVRADSFFDNGNYDAILPIVRIVTWLDPKQIDVFATGMWHIGYNFTDEEQRSDRRYIPSALALGMEGAKKNPETYEMFFETGWMWFNKIDDNYAKAVKWMQEANSRKDMLPARRNMLANAYERNGQVDLALKTRWELWEQANERVLKGNNYSDQQQRDTLEAQIDTTIVRMSQRGWYAKEMGDAGGANPPVPFDPDPPFDVQFSVRATVVEPRVVQIEGTWGVLPVGTRIRCILRDATYPDAIAGSVEWDKRSEEVNLDPPRGLTYLQDQLYVRNRRFNKKINMAADPTMYSFSTDNYFLEFYYNPRSAAPHIQDKFSWNGEGLTDQNFLNDQIRPGVRVIYTKFDFSRDELLRLGKFVDQTPVRSTKNFVQMNRKNIKEIINAPSVLDATPQTPTLTGKAEHANEDEKGNKPK